MNNVAPPFNDSSWYAARCMFQYYYIFRYKRTSMEKRPPLRIMISSIIIVNVGEKGEDRPGTVCPRDEIAFE